MGRVWLVSAWRGSSPRGSPGGTWPGCCRRKLHHQKKHLAPVLRIRIRRIHICNFPVSGFKKLDPDSHKEEQLDPIHKKCMRIHSPDFLPALTKKKTMLPLIQNFSCARQFRKSHSADTGHLIFNFKISLKVWIVSDVLLPWQLQVPSSVFAIIWFSRETTSASWNKWKIIQANIYFMF